MLNFRENIVTYHLRKPRGFRLLDFSSTRTTSSTQFVTLMRALKKNCFKYTQSSFKKLQLFTTLYFHIYFVLSYAPRAPSKIIAVQKSPALFNVIF